MAINGHSRIGASSCERWWNCPASVGLSEQVEKETSIFAAEGTVAHTLAEWMLENKVNKDTYRKRLNEVVIQDGFEITISQEMCDYIYGYIQFLRREFVRISKLYGKDIKFHIETEFTLTKLHKDAFGTNDACIVAPIEALFVYDLKYGQNHVVDAHENKQLLYYALGVYYKYNMPVKKIVLTIYQPRVETPVTIWECSEEHLLEFEEELKKRMKAVYTKNPKVERGDWCGFCKAKKTVCPLDVESSLSVIGQENLDLKNKVYDVTQLTPIQLSNILPKVKDIVALMKAIEKQAIKMLENGDKIVGYGLEDDMSAMEWIDVDKALKVLDKYGDKIYNPKKLMTPTQASKVITKDELNNLSQRTIKGKKLCIIKN